MNKMFGARKLFRMILAISSLAFLYCMLPEGDSYRAYAQTPTASVRIWDIESQTGPNPDQTVEDITGLTRHVATPTNPLTLVTVIENTTHPGGPCGVIYWNPATNFFKWYGVGGRGSGFQASVDLNTSGPTMTGPAGATFQPGDVWAGISGGVVDGGGPLWMNFRGTDRFRSYLVSALWGVHVASDGMVWFAEYGARSVSRLNPANNMVTRWRVDGMPAYLTVAPDGYVYATLSTSQQVVRVDPRTNEVLKWSVPGFFRAILGKETPDGIDVDGDSNVWFVGTAANKVGRINPGTNMFCEFARPGINDPQLIATTGRGDTLQAFITEGSGRTIDVLTEVRGRSCASCRTVAPARSVVTPTTVAVAHAERTIAPRTATITPTLAMVPGPEVNCIARYGPIPGLTFLSGQTGVVGSNTLFGSDLNGNKVYEFRAPLIGMRNRPPVFDSPPTPIDRLTVQAGTELTFVVQATDPDAGDTVTLGVIGLPAGASFPMPPIVNPARGTFRWTPTVTQVGTHSVTFTATDNHGLAGTPRTIEIRVTNDPIRDLPPEFTPPTPPADPPLRVDVDRNISFMVRATDPEADDPVRLFATGLPSGASFTTPGPANPATGTFSWTPIREDTGVHRVNFIAQDRVGGTATRTVTIIVGSGPLLTITKSGTPNPVNVGAFICYTIGVRNSGSAAANDVVITDTLPPGTNFISTPRSFGTFDEKTRTVTWNLGALAPSTEDTEVFLIIEVPDSYEDDTVANTATVRASNAAARSATTINQVGGELGAEVLNGLFSNNAGPVIIQFTVTNRSSDFDFNNVVVEAPLPPGSNFISADRDGSLTGRTVSWNLGTVAAGRSVRVRLTVSPPAAEGVLPIEVSAEGDELAPLAATAFTLLTNEGSIRVSQESSRDADDFDDNILGDIDAYYTNLSASEFYNYRFLSFNGPWPALVAHRSHLFLVNSSVDGLALFVVHDKRHNGRGGRFSNQVDLVGVEDAQFLVQDDPTEIEPGHLWVGDRGDNLFLGQGSWTPDTTDGFVLGPFDGDWEAFIKFLGFAGLDDWYGYSASGAPPIRLNLVAGRRVRLEGVASLAIR